MPRKINSAKAPAQGKVLAKRAVRKKTATKRQTKLSKEIPPSENLGSQFMHFLVSIVITAIVVGGAIFIVQKMISSRHISEAKNETENVKSEFQSKLEELKNKLQGTENENEELKNKKEKLQEIVNNANINYKNEELGISFSYPAVYGDVIINYEDGDSGQKFLGTFSDFGDVVFGGISPDYTTSKKLTLTDTQGYRKRGGVYSFKSLGEDPEVYEVETFKVLEVDDTEIPVIDKENFLEENNALSFDDVVAEIEDNGQVTIGATKNKLLALVNLEGEKFIGLAFLDNNTENEPFSNFEEILNSVSVSKPVVNEEIVE